MNRSTTTGKKTTSKRSQSATPTSASNLDDSATTSSSTLDKQSKTKSQSKKEKESKTTMQPTLTLFSKRFSTAATNEENDSDNDADPTSQSEDPNCSNVDILKYLSTMNESIQGKLDVVNETVEQLKGEIFDLHQQNEQLREELLDYKSKQEDLQQQVEEMRHIAKLALDHTNRNEQYSRRNNIKILFMEEDEKTSESLEESEKKVLEILHGKLNLKNIKSEHIEIAHRVGDKRKIRNRPMIVKFLSRKTKLEVMRNKKLLKQSTPKLVITEDLTKINYQLYKTVLDHEETSQAWTHDGKVFAKDLNDKIHKIETTLDLQKLSTPSSRTLRKSRRQNET